MDHWKLGAVEAVALLESGRLSLPDYVDALIARAQCCSSLNSMVDFDPALLRSEVRRNHAAPLHGLPLSIKANIDVAGRISSGGTPALKDWRPPVDAPAIARLRESGAIVFAKDNLHELALGSTSNNAATGAVRNPWNRTMISGGSSGGTAANIASGIVSAGLGSDTAGSCRIPASLCGCVGFRPSMGRYPMAGVIPMSHQRDTVGPLARSVADIDLIDRSIDAARAPLQRLAPSGLRLGLPRGPVWDDVDAACAPALQAALSLLRQAGATLIDIDIDLPDEATRNAHTMAVVAGDMPGDIQAYLDAHDLQLDVRDVFAAMASPAERELLLAQLGPDAIPKALYEEATRVVRPRLQASIKDNFARHRLDAMVMPATALPARPIGEDATVDLNGTRQPTVTVYIRTTDIACAAQTPSISVPAGFTRSGLPIGLMFDGLAGQDAHLLAVASAFESLRGPWPFPPLWHEGAKHG